MSDYDEHFSGYHLAGGFVEVVQPGATVDVGLAPVGVEYIKDHRQLVWTDANGASAVVARDVPTWFGELCEDYFGDPMPKGDRP